MSADDGIYILETSGPEFRVAHLAAIENVDWDREKRLDSSDPDVHIKNARDMWRSCKVFTSKAEVLVHASELLEEVDYTEYGISFIKIPRKF